MSGHGVRVLIVDDNPQNLKLTRLVLAQDGFDVRTAVDAEEALDAMRVARPSVILMDLQMPGIDGLALTRQLKGDPATQSIVIIALTAYAMKGDEDRALAAGCDGYIAKPVNTRTLGKTILAELARTSKANPTRSQ